MNIFLNAILESGKIILFDENREILKTKDIKTLWNESEKLLWFMDDFLKDNNLNYNDIKNIVVVAWPWSFTWIRTISLLVNTINFVTKNNITPISFFDMYKDYPIIKSSSKRDSFFQKNKTSKIEVIKNDEIIDYLVNKKITKVFGENKNISLSKTFQQDEKSFNFEIFENIDYSAIIKEIEFKNDKIINPIYIKKPSIS